jgi:hypothetical protein
MFSSWATALDSHADGHNKLFRRVTFLFFAIANVLFPPVLVLLLLLLILSSALLLSVLGEELITSVQIFFYSKFVGQLDKI